LVRETEATQETSVFNGTFKLGRVAGIPLSANWSVIFIGGLLTVSLATGVLPAAAAGIAPLTAWLLGLVGAAVFLGSLIAHELGHSVVARRAGVAVDEITLWLFGGVAKLRSEPRTADDELRIAAAGPAVSAALAAGFGVAAFGLAGLGVPAALVALVGWLGVVNAALAIFNLLPGLPLDGGRILRAWLWRRRGDKLSATVTAAGAGRLLGGGLMALGVIQLLGGGAGLWTAAIGFMLFNAAKAELVGQRARHSLQDATVGEVMEPIPPVVPADATAMWMMPVLSHSAGSYLLHDEEDRIVGLVTLDQVRDVPLHGAGSTSLRSIAHTVERGDLRVVSSDQHLDDGYGSHMIVFDRGQLVGVVTPGGIARWLMGSRSSGRPPFATTGGSPRPPFTPGHRPFSTQER
jgi:Zn-dependent protease